MKFNFDLTTMEGRGKACEQFAKAMNEALSKDKGDEEAVIVMYKDGEHTLGSIAGRSSEVSELEAKMLAQYPELMETTLKMVPMMLMMKHLDTIEKDGE